MEAKDWSALPAERICGLRSPLFRTSRLEDNRCIVPGEVIYAA